MAQAADIIDNHPWRFLSSYDIFYETSIRFIVVLIGFSIVVILMEMDQTVPVMGP